MRALSKILFLLACGLTPTRSFFAKEIRNQDYLRALKSLTGRTNACFESLFHSKNLRSPKKVFDLLLKMRIENLTQEERDFLEPRLRNVLLELRIYPDQKVAQGVVDPEKLTVRLWLPKEFIGTAIDYFLLFHETEHLVQVILLREKLGFRTSEYTLGELANFMFHEEMGAMRAEWAYLQALSLRQRQEALALVKQSSLEEPYRSSLERVFSNAHLSAEEYIQNELRHGRKSRMNIKNNLFSRIPF